MKNEPLTPEQVAHMVMVERGLESRYESESDTMQRKMRAAKKIEERREDEAIETFYD